MFDAIVIVHLFASTQTLFWRKQNMKKFLSLIAAVLVLATCLSVTAVAAEEIQVKNVAVDCLYNNKPARPEACIPALRQDGDLWFNCSTNDTPTGGSIAGGGERYLTIGLAQDADLTSIKIQWFQGNGPAPDYAVMGDKQRQYMFVIQASKESSGDDNFVDIYGNYNNSDIKMSGTGMDAEEYTVNFKGAKRIRIWGFGSTGDIVGGTGAMNFAIRELRVFGNGLGGNGGDAGQSGDDGSGGKDNNMNAPQDNQGGDTGSDNGGNTTGGNTTGGNTTGGNTTGNGGSQAPTTGDFENLLIFGTVAVLSCAAVVIIRKKIRER